MANYISVSDKIKLYNHTKLQKNVRVSTETGEV